MARPADDAGIFAQAVKARSHYLEGKVIGAGSCPRANWRQACISVSAMLVRSDELTRSLRISHSA